MLLYYQTLRFHRLLSELLHALHNIMLRWTMWQQDPIQSNFPPSSRSIWLKQRKQTLLLESFPFYDSSIHLNSSHSHLNLQPVRSSPTTNLNNKFRELVEAHPGIFKGSCMDNNLLQRIRYFVSRDIVFTEFEQESQRGPGIKRP